MATKKKTAKDSLDKQALKILRECLDDKLQFDDALYTCPPEKLGLIIHELNQQWWRSLKTGRRIERNFGELVALVHSELSEALEGHRKNKSDEHLPHRPSAEVELADAVIRILDLGEGFGFDVWGALIEKLWYNLHREDHKHEHRKGKHGKKY